MLAWFWVVFWLIFLVQPVTENIADGGRRTATVRAAINELFDYGRPARVELAVLRKASIMNRIHSSHAPCSVTWLSSR